MKEHRKNRKRKPPLFLAGLVFMLSVLFLIPGRALAAAKAEGGDALSMEVSYGFADMVKGERYLDITVLLKNQTAEDFAGNLEFLTTESSLEVYRYDYPAAVSAGEQVRKSFDIPLGVKTDQMFVRVTDDDGAVVLQKRLKLNISTDVSECFIGVFSDQPDSLEFFDEVGIHYGSIKTKLVPLTGSQAPDSALGYDQLDMILVSDCDLNELSEQQHNALIRWVEKGGTLLIGGGKNYRKNMGRFADEILESPSMEPFRSEVNLGAEFSQNAPQDAVLELVCADLELKNGSILMQGESFPLLSFVHQKQGRIAAAAFSLKDIRSFCEEHPAFLEHFYTTVFGEKKVESLSQSDYSGFSRLYFSVQGLINTGDAGRLPNVILYTVIIIIYLLLIGPVLYLCLKKRNCHRFYLAGALASAFVFTGIIYIMGLRTRFGGPFFTYATILDTSDGRAEEETYINVRSPYNKPYTVSLKPEYTVRPVTKSYYYDSISAVKFTGAENYKTNLRFLEDRTEIKIRDTVAFTPKLFMLSRELGGKKNMGIGGNITFFDGEVGGRIVNQFDCRLEDAILLLFGKVVRLGDLEPGEERDLKECEVLNYPLSYTYALAQKVTGGDQYEKADIGDEGYMRFQARSRLLNFYLDSRMGYTTEARLVAFSPDLSGDGFLNDGEYITGGISMVTSDVDLTREKNGLVCRAALEQEANVISGNFEADYNSIYVGEPSEPTIVEYALGNDLEIEKVNFEKISPAFFNDPKYPYLTVFEGKMYFYNYDTGHNDLMEQKDSYTAAELEPYLSPTNTLTVKYVDEASSEYSWERHLPMLYVIGKEK